MGAAACCHLSRRGARVLGLEQFDIPHDLGSSHGSSRVIRLAYFEDPRYVPLVRRAFEHWHALEAAEDERLVVMTGGLDLAHRDSTELRNVEEGLRQNQLAFERLDAAEVRRRFPALRPPADHHGIWQADTGFILPERGIIAHVHAAQQAGADCRAREAVLSWRAGDGRVSVQTDRGEYSARQLILTAGAWLPTIAPEFSRSLWIERQVQAWFQPRDIEPFRVGRLPIFVHHLPEGTWYGLPHHGRPGVKISRHHGGTRTSANDVIRTPTRADEEDVRRYLRQCLPDADGPVMAMKVCLYTNSPDGHFVIDRHPRHPEVLVAGGFSGHGYKFAPVVGEILADLFERGRTELAIELFRASRL